MKFKTDFYPVFAILFGTFLIAFIFPQKKETILVPLREISSGTVSGEAIFNEINGKVIVNVNTKKADSSEQGAFLQKGNCEYPREAVYYLTRLQGGKSSSTMAISLADLVRNDVSVVTIYDGLKPDGRILFCGEFRINFRVRPAPFPIKLNSYYLQIEDQPISVSIQVKKLFLPRPGYVAIYQNQEIDKESNLVGISDYLPARIYKGLNIELFLNFQKDHELKDKFFVVVYEDNGDKYFDRTLDKPVVDFWGKMIHQYVFFKG